MRLLPLIGFLIGCFSSTALAQDVLEVDFTGTDPALNVPWSSTSFLAPNLSFSGIDFGSGAFPNAGYTDTFAFHVSVSGGVSTLADAILHDEYLAFSLAPTSGAMDLGGRKVAVGIERNSYWSPAQYTLFSSIDGFMEGQQLFSTVAVDRGFYTDTEYAFIFPLSGYDGITAPVEFRLVAHDAQYDHPTKLTSLSIVDAGPVFSLALSGNAGGNVSTNPQGVVFEAGTLVQLLADPESGSFFSGWSGDVVGRGNPRTILMNQDYVIAGTFTANPLPHMELGMNLDGINDWSTSWKFVDVMETSRDWLTRSVGGFEWESGFTSEMSVDADGWPLQIPFVASDGQSHFAHNILAFRLSGDYTLIAEGTGRIELKGGATRQTFQFTGGTSSFTFHVPVIDVGSAMFLELEESIVSDPLVNIRVIRPGFDTVYQTDPFHPLYMDRLAPFGNIRFMDWGHTNNSSVSTWGDHVDKSYYTQASGRGVSLSYVAEFAELSGKDPWICIPHLADDNYVREAARLLRDEVSTDKKIYVEYSNETWNTQFFQTTYVQDMGQLLGLSANRWEAGQLYCGLRSIEIWAIFEQEFLDDSRLVKVLGTHSAGLGTTETRFMALNDPALNPQYLMPDALAIAPYFGHSFAISEIPPIAPSYPTVDDLLESYAPSSILAKQLEVQGQKQIAEEQGVSLICYEGGQHFTGLFPANNDLTLVDLLIAANRDPRMGELYLDYLDMLQREGITLFEHFDYIEEPSKYGSWGSLEYQDQSTASAPKYQALVDWLVPVLSVENLVAGQNAEVHIQRATPGGTVAWGFSLAGAGPTPTPFGDLLLSLPLQRLADAAVDLDGKAMLSHSVPAGAAGTSIWFHAYDVSSQTFSNGLSAVIL